MDNYLLKEGKEYFYKNEPYLYSHSEKMAKGKIWRFIKVKDSSKTIDLTENEVSRFISEYPLGGKEFKQILNSTFFFKDKNTGNYAGLSGKGSIIYTNQAEAVRFTPEDFEERAAKQLIRTESFVKEANLGEYKDIESQESADLSQLQDLETVESEDEKTKSYEEYDKWCAMKKAFTEEEYKTILKKLKESEKGSLENEDFIKLTDIINKIEKFLGDKPEIKFN